MTRRLVEMQERTVEVDAADEDAAWEAALEVPEDGDGIWESTSEDVLPSHGAEQEEIEVIEPEGPP
jgi:hypothetical protein